MMSVSAALMERGSAASEPPNLDDLACQIERAWQIWQQPSAFRYVRVGAMLPELIRGVQSAAVPAAVNQRRRGLRLASTLYQLTRTWTKRVGEFDLSMVAADRAVSHALDADDPDLAGAAAWNLAMILFAQGKVEQASAVVHRAIEELRSHMSTPAPTRMAVFGGLHLLGGAVAARQRHVGETNRLLETAAAIAGETNHFRIAFGPTNVAVHRVSTAVELGHAGDALALSERITVHHTAPVERRLTFHLDTASCYARKQNEVAAVHMLQHVHRESPEELRYNAMAHETLRYLKARAKPSVNAELRPMLAAANLAD